MDKNITVLIVDDSEYQRNLFKSFLETEYNIIEAANGNDAILQLTMNRVNIGLVLLDLIMPDMDGFEVLERMNRMGWIEDIPVIMISPDNTSEIAQKAYDLGVADFISKDIEQNIINKRVENTIRIFTKQKLMLKLMAEENQRIQNIDPLTGVLNMNGFQKRACELIKNHGNDYYCIHYFDIKNFKFVNDLYGIETGDKLLKFWAGEILKGLSDKEIIGRVNADHFVVMNLTNRTKEEDARFDEVSVLASRFLDRPGRPYKLDFVCGTYILENDDYIDPDIENLISHAIVAHKNASTKRGTFHEFFNRGEWEKQWRLNEISQKLDQSLVNGSISVWLQPQYSFEKKKIVSAEALCRWNHPDLGFISPAEFIPALEKTGQIYSLDKYMWEQVCILLKKYRKNPANADLTVSVNISRADITADSRPDEFIERLIKRYGIPPSCLHVEITESAYVEDSDLINSLVNRFHQKGFIVEMDDFGSGYSSLNSLKDIDVDILKLDMGFLRNSVENEKGGKILDLVIQMAKKLDIGVVAEGIETVHQAQFLGELGCDIMQGYYFSKPIPEDQFSSLLKDKNEHFSEIIKNNPALVPKKLHNGYSNQNRDNEIFGQIFYQEPHNIDSVYRFNTTPCGIFTYEADGNQTFDYVNEGVLWLLGYPSIENFRQHFGNSFYNMVYEEDRDRIMKEISAQINSECRHDYCEYRVVCADGSLKWVYDVGYYYTDANGKNWFYVVIQDRDLSIKRISDDYANSERYLMLSKIKGFNVFEYVIENDLLIADITRENGYHFSSNLENFSKRMGKDGLVDSETEVVFSKLIESVKANKISSGSFRCVCRFKGDIFHTYRCFFNVEGDRLGNPIKIIGYATNTDQENSDIVLWKDKASRDSMTNLLNHEAAIHELDHKLSEGKSGTAILIDVDDFKDINDKFGHLNGDKVLMEVASILNDSVRQNDIVGRYGGDEFIIFLTNLTDYKTVENKLQRILNAFDAYKVNNQIPVHLSLGAYICKTHNVNAEEILKKADDNLYRSKQAGKNQFTIS